jgi:DNA-binding response OmpR family regulator
MPGMNGMEVARQVRSQFSTIPILFITGYVDQAVLADIGEARIIRKPFVGDDLATKVHAALLKTSSRSEGKVLQLRR